MVIVLNGASTARSPLSARSVFERCLSSCCAGFYAFADRALCEAVSMYCRAVELLKTSRLPACNSIIPNQQVKVNCVFWPRHLRQNLACTVV